MVFVALGCSSASEAPAPLVDSGTTTTDTATTDAPPGDAGDAAMCDVGTPPPGVSKVSAEILFLEDGGAPPSAMGGDPTGDWIITKLTLYLSPDAKDQIDVTKSTIEGTGWSSFSGTSYRLQNDFQLKLVTTIVGTVNQGIQTLSKGTFANMGSDVVFTPACVISNSSSPTNKVGWTRVADDKAQMFIPPGMGPGAALNRGLVAELTRVK
ncbi:MAG: hypothetical protein ACXWUG_03970 [Polyangiales bacterium]